MFLIPFNAFSLNSNGQYIIILPIYYTIVSRRSQNLFLAGSHAVFAHAGHRFPVYLEGSRLVKANRYVSPAENRNHLAVLYMLTLKYRREHRKAFQLSAAP